MLLTALLMLAIAASSALVFTNRVELLKLAVILALWAAVVAAFVSVIYRRQSDVDQAKVRDLKLVYDLQLDREISARREYELSLETQLRRELASEVQAQAADEVANLRAELAALRANLEILFDADLSHRPAIENERTTVRAYSDWARDAETTGRVTASRIDADYHGDTDVRTEESPIIDVPAVPHPTEYEWTPPPPPPAAGGAHRRPSDVERDARRHAAEAPSSPSSPWSPLPPPQPSPPPQPQPEPVAQSRPENVWPPTPEPPEPPPMPEPPMPEPQQPEPVADWWPAPAEGEFIPAGQPGSNWLSPENGAAGEYVGRRRAPEPDDRPTEIHPAMATPPPEPRRGRHSAAADTTDPGRAPAPPTLATEPAQPPPRSEPEAAESKRRRHRSADDDDTGGQSVADLLARLQATPSPGGRRRRREE
jgi:hypothetical protein